MPLILIIDDDDNYRTMLKRTLEREGYETAVAENGKRGMELARSSAPDLVITDLVMPEKEGIETIIELKKEYPGLQIIAISGAGNSGPEDYLKLAKHLGSSYTFAKPFPREELIKVVKELLEE